MLYEFNLDNGVGTPIVSAVLIDPCDEVVQVPVDRIVASRSRPAGATDKDPDREEQLRGMQLLDNA